MKKLLSALLIFTLSANQIGQSCRGENVNPVITVQKDQGETGEKETSQQKLNEKVLARLIELEAKIDKKEDKKKEETPENIFVKVFSGIKKGVFFVIKKFFWLLAGVGTCTGFTYFFLVRHMEKAIDKVDKATFEEARKCLESARDLFIFLYQHKELANGILNNLFENISGNYGDHKLTPEEKKRIKDFGKEFIKRFHPDNISRLKNLTKEDLEELTKKVNDVLDMIGK